MLVRPGSTWRKNDPVVKLQPDAFVPDSYSEDEVAAVQRYRFEQGKAGSRAAEKDRQAKRAARQRRVAQTQADALQADLDARKARLVR